MKKAPRHVTVSLTELSIKGRNKKTTWLGSKLKKQNPLSTAKATGLLKLFPGVSA